MEQKIISKNLSDTQSFAKKIASKLKGGEVVLLYGDLGSGKTSFAQSLGEALGITKKIISPTFIIMRSYDLPKKIGSAEHLYHLDLYRTESDKDIMGLGVFDLVNKKENIILIEWPEKMRDQIPKNAITIRFRFIDEQTREIILQN